MFKVIQYEDMVENNCYFVAGFNKKSKTTFAFAFRCVQEYDKHLDEIRGIDFYTSHIESPSSSAWVMSNVSDKDEYIHYKVFDLGTTNVKTAKKLLKEHFPEYLI